MIDNTWTVKRTIMFVLLFAILVALLFIVFLRYKAPTPGIIGWIKTNTTWIQAGKSNQGWAGFDRVYFLTLPKRAASVREVVKQMGISDSAWILKAFDINELDPSMYADETTVTKKALAKLHKNSALGAFGCYLSHFAAIKHCYDDPNVNTCVIFEDDIQIVDPNYLDIVNKFVDEINQKRAKWDLLYLDFHRASMDSLALDSNVAVRLQGCFGGHAYVVNKISAGKITSQYFPMQYQLDMMFKLLVSTGKLTSFGINGQHKIFAQNRTLLSNINGTFRLDEPKFSYLDYKDASVALPKVFQIGMHHCGSDLLQKFFHFAGLVAVPLRDQAFTQDALYNYLNKQQIISEQFSNYMYFNIADIHNDKADFPEYLTFTAFKETYNQYPDAKYIFNTRDKHKWLQDLMALDHGKYIQLLCDKNNLSNLELMTLLAEQWDQHHQAVLDFFADKPGKLLIFNIDTDAPQRLLDFLGAEYKLDLAIYNEMKK